MTPTRFMVIDDDPINNMLCRMLLKGTLSESEIQTFNIPEVGFEYIETEYAKSMNDTQTILFLDINMPSWSGWDFLDNFEVLSEQIKKQFIIYMLSSSVDPNDKERAHSYKNVVDYIEKPLKRELLLKLFS